MYKITEKKETVENEERTVYGIACEETRIDNLSADRKSVERLVSLCNTYSLSPCHLTDVAEDFAAE